MTTTDRDRLLQNVAEALDDACIGGGAGIDAYELERVSGHVTDALLAAGVTLPRRIVTAEELDALPVGAVVEDAYAAICIRLEADPLPYDWVRVTTSVKGHSHRHRPYLPALVLWTPGGAS